MAFSINMNPLPRKGMNKGAYRGDLNCPVCNSRAVRFIEMIGPYRRRYRCRKCGMPFQYETGHDESIHPYAPFKKTRWQRIVDHVNKTKVQGRTK